MPNQLIHATSPYLLQHAHNPVDWYEWTPQTLQRAREEDKPILVSIGYSACHWCHVMERESFENEDIAQLMNEFFICIKVDREERPDVDAIYMEAVQALGFGGGWPLNVFLTPKQEPFFGGTYFPPQQWAKALINIHNAFREQRQEIEDTAQKLTTYLQGSELGRMNLTSTQAEYKLSILQEGVKMLKERFDDRHGGMGTAPKFPMPSLYTFLLYYYTLSNDQTILDHVELTLDRMLAGGIYDQIGGGFARYSVDEYWFAPHFEKMLYDNAQLLSVYAFAYKYTHKESYRLALLEMVNFLEREMLSPENAFYSALDADSEGVEGKFYVWQTADIERLLGEDAPLFKAYYSMSDEGNWEDSNILFCFEEAAAFAAKYGISRAIFEQKIQTWKAILWQERQLRIRPHLDDKILASWNGLAIKGLCDAYTAIQSPHFLNLAMRNADFCIEKLISPEGKIAHTYKNQQCSMHGYLEDYAALIQGFFTLYQVSFEEKYIFWAEKMMEYALLHFWDNNEKMFFFAHTHENMLIAQKKELFDNVIPSSNSMMAQNLHYLGILLDKTDYIEKSEKMLSAIIPLLSKELGYTSNWAFLYACKLQTTPEVAIVGSNYKNFAAQLQRLYYPNIIFSACETSSTMPLLVMREAFYGLTTIYVCRQKSCLMPVYSPHEAMEFL